MIVPVPIHCLSLTFTLVFRFNTQVREHLVNTYLRDDLLCTDFSAFRIMKPDKLPHAVITKYCEESDQFGQQSMFLRIPKFFVCWLTVAFIKSYTCLSYVSYQNKQRRNISTRTTLNSIQLVHRSITNGAKLINLPPNISLFGRFISWI